MLKELIYESIIENSPGYLYWKNRKFEYVACNKNLAIAQGFNSPNEIVGKTDHDFDWGKYDADKFRADDLYVMKTGNIHVSEYKIPIPDNKFLWVRTEKKPWYDKNGEIIGIIGVAVDVTQQKQKRQKLSNEKDSALYNLKTIIENMPGFVYWKNTKSEYMGCNKNLARFSKLNNPKEIIGKTDYDFAWGKEQAAQFIRDDQEILRTGIVQTTEYELPEKREDGKNLYVRTDKMPLYDRNGVTIGILGVAVDITDQKLAEALRLKNQSVENQLKEKNKFQSFVEQVAHDIRSPLASIIMLSKYCTTIPEDTRIALREASNTINDIAQSLLVRYFGNDIVDSQENDRINKEKVVLSLQILETLTSKRYQYKDSSINFSHKINTDDYFLTVKGDKANIKRMLSNLLNNAVDACKGKNNNIVIELESTNENISIIVSDDGIGIPAEILKKLRDRLSVTANKDNGHGIGLQQVHETLDEMEGEISIDSLLGKGTTVKLTFPKINLPTWLANRIVFDVNDQVLILDDDNSIHLAWDRRLQHIGIYPKHFKSANKLLNYINNKTDKNQFFLLTDYELLDQEINGIDVIKKSQIQRTALVTSHYNNIQLQKEIISLKSKIIAKNLVHEIPIVVRESEHSQHAEQQTLVDLVILDDDITITNHLFTLLKGKKIHVYNKVDDFFNNLSNYPTHTLFFLDNQLKHQLTGIEIAKDLRALGYDRLHLFSAKSFKNDEIPDYLNVIDKLDIDHLKQIVNDNEIIAEKSRREKKYNSLPNTFNEKENESYLSAGDLIHELMTPLTYTSLLVQELKLVIKQENTNKLSNRLIHLTHDITHSLKFACNFSRLRLSNWQYPFNTNGYQIKSTSALLSHAIKHYPFLEDINSLIKISIVKDFYLYIDSEHFTFIIWHIIKEASEDGIKITAKTDENQEMNTIEIKKFSPSHFILQYCDMLITTGGGKIRSEKRSEKLCLFFPKID